MTDQHHPSPSPATVAVHAGRPGRRRGGAVNPPIPLNSTYVSQGEVPPGELAYARADTDAWHAFEDALAALEDAAERGIVFSSGMAAIAAVLSLVPDGGVLVLPRHAYQTTSGYADDLAARHGVAVRRVDIADTDAVVAALDGADLLLVESPTNPMLEVADLPALLSAARERGVRTAVDNTFATPLGQRPLGSGADLVLHSVSKFLAGHSDVILGAVVTNDPGLAARIRGHRTLHGAIAGPFEVWLALRGLRTFPLRFERACANAAELARRLAGHPGVAEVRHPSLPGDPGHVRASAHMDAYGAIVGVRPVSDGGAGSAAAADAVVGRCRLWVPATSLGGVESLIERRRRWGTESVTVPEDLLRLSVGVEDVEDLWADLDRALRPDTLGG
ncbi:trans-sulfuration enzyme family protein [Myceligenerans salitolerans]|uniref:Aminotransferase class I/II-fold pyridoxal phosphate-dependent enzyme n=1 Tax=Myceligenerans salitolerans TaxID=1230528 RepID=A0ABS3I6B2_9MICO|nr:aminotransferase class I/II-fold pyridoxal phosphate-dependent enzyme [Myceligenerans salitolerans]MBO0607622.1 aminotransferase class I/II-fold pyridoxal phosphate-dependent enzyme [Myceligenerans salitolerans]